MRDMDVPRAAGPGFLDLTRVDPVLRDAATLWIADFVKLYEDDGRCPTPEVLAARVSLPATGRSIPTIRRWPTSTAPPLPPDTDLFWEDGLLDVAFVYPDPVRPVEVRHQPGPDAAGMRVNVVMRFLPPGGAERAFDVHGDPGIVQLDPRWHQAALRFVKDGFFHILDGIDHLLFLLCLVIPFRRSALAGPRGHRRSRIAHSVTLIASAFDMAPGALWFPPLIETLIAVSIVYMAFENIVGAARAGDAGGSRDRRALERRWVVAFGFGLVHGFGFSFALRESLQFAGAHLLTSLLAFNVGVELGQLLVLVILVPALNLALPLRRRGADRDDPAVGAGRAHRLALGHRARRPAAAVSVADSTPRCCSAASAC